MVRIGICGSICAGKSTFCKLLESKYQCHLIDADKVGHECYLKDTPCYHKIIEHFSDIVIDEITDEIDRKRLGNIVFNDKVEMINLQEIVWPDIKNKIKNRMEVYEKENPGKNIIVEAAILIEADWLDLFDIIVVLHANDDIALDRLIKRNTLSIDEARRRLNLQLTMAQKKDKLKNVNYIILENNEDMDTLLKSQAYSNFIQTYF